MRQTALGAFNTYLVSKVAKTLARCWKVTRKDGVILGFTTHTRDIVFQGVPYYMVWGLTTSSVKSSEGFSVDNLAISAFLTAQNETDILAGKYDGATLEVFTVNYLNLGLGKLIDKVGFLGEVTRADGVFQAELRGLMDMLRTKIGRVYTAACDARLGDARCGFNLTPVPMTITAVTGPKSFQATALAGFPTGSFTVGYLRFLAGENVGVERDIRFHAGINIDLFLAPVFPMVVDELVFLYQGCDKTKSTCIRVFNNVVNFRGFDYVPTIEQVFDSPINLQPNLTICAQEDPGYADVPLSGGGMYIVPPPESGESDTGGGDSDSGC
jgi:uncharacterized phage protein (TIGR02218 family)